MSKPTKNPKKQRAELAKSLKMKASKLAKRIQQLEEQLQSDGVELVVWLDYHIDSKTTRNREYGSDSVTITHSYYLLGFCEPKGEWLFVLKAIEETRDEDCYGVPGDVVAGDYYTVLTKAEPALMAEAASHIEALEEAITSQLTRLLADVEDADQKLREEPPA